MNIVISKSNPTAIREITRLISRGGETPFRATRARINYNLSTPSSEIPLIINGTIGSLPVEIQILDGVACGFLGTMTHSTLCILLDNFGFEVEPDDIMTDKHADSNGWIRLEYTKNF